MSRAREQANLSSDSNIFVDIANDRTGIGVTTPSQKLEIAGNIKLGDNQEILIGTGSDLKLWHDGTHSYIRTTSGTQNLNLQTTNGQVVLGEDGGHIGLYYQAGGTVELRYNNVKTFETVSGGSKVTGDLDVTGHIDVGDGVNIKLGADDDLKIWHDGGGHNYIRGTDSTRNYIQHGTHNAIITYPSSSVELYFNNSKKFETSSTGATLNGVLTTTQLNVTNGLVANLGGNGYDIKFGDSTSLIGFRNRVRFGDGEDMTLFHNGSHSYITNATGNLLIQNDNTSTSEEILIQAKGDEHGIRLVANGAVELYHDASKKFETSSTGSKVTGDLDVTGNIDVADNVRIKLGTGDDMSIFHDSGTTKFTDSGPVVFSTTSFTLQSPSDESIIVGTQDGSVDLYHNNSKKIETTSAGAKVTGNLEVTGVLTYDDVTNIDSVGIITARAGINLTGGNITLGDSGGASDDRIVLGAGSDLSVYHDGSFSRIKDSGTNALIIQSSEIRLQNEAANETMAIFISDGASELYHNNTKRFATSGNGTAFWGSNHHFYGQNTSGNSNCYIEARSTGTAVYQGLILKNSDGSANCSLTSHGGNTLFTSATTHVWSVNGMSPHERIELVSSGFNPRADGLVTLGTTSKRWGNVHADAATINGTISGVTGTFSGGAAASNALLVTGNYDGSNPNVDIQTWQRTGGAVQAKMIYKDATTDLHFGSDTAHNFSIMTGGTDRLRITSAGRVALGGETSPSHTFHVRGEAENCIRWIRTGSSVGGSLYSDGGGSGIVGGDGVLANTGIYLVTDTRIDFRVNGSERLRILQDGEVLIGGRTAKPNDINKLVVTGTSPADTFDSTLYLEGSETSGAANTGGALAFGGHDGSNHRNWANIYGMKENATGGNYAGYISFHTRPAGGSPTERLRIESTGEVHISDRNSANAGEHILQGGAFGIRMQDTGGYNRWNIERNYGGWQSVPLVHLSAQGRVGINQASPGSALNVKAIGSASDGLQVTSSGHSSYVWQIQNNDNLFNGSLAGELGIRGSSGIAFSANAGTSTHLRINSVGQIGIRGTTAAFDTTGDPNNGALQLHYSTNSGQASIGPYSSGGSTHLSFYTNAGGAAATEKLRINSSGQVSIGNNPTVASDAALHIELDGTREYLRLEGDGGTSNAYIELEAPNDRRKAIIFKSGGTRRGVIGVGDSDEASATSLFFSASSNIAGNSPHMVIDSSGRVLIGTTSHGYQAQVTIKNVNDFSTASISTTTDNIYLISDSTSGDGVYGASIGFSRVGYADRRAAAIATVQKGSDEDHVGLAFFTHDNADATQPIVEKLRIASTGSVTIGDAATHTYSAHSEGDDLVVGGAGWRGMTIYGTSGSVIQFADAADNRIGQILYNHSDNSMLFRVNGNVNRLVVKSDGDTDIYGSQVHLYNNVNTSNTYFVAQNTGAGNAGIRIKNNQGDFAIIANDRLRFYDVENSQERLAIDSNGRILVGTTSYKSNLNSTADTSGQIAQFVGATNNVNHCVGIFAYSGTSNPTVRGAKLQLNRARSTDGTTNTALANNDLIGTIEWKGNDGTSFSAAAKIDCFVEDTSVAADHMGGRLCFSTSPDGSAVPQERLRIGSGGQVMIGPIADFTEATCNQPVYIEVETDVTNVAYGEGSYTTGLVRIEERGSNNNRYHGIDLRNRESGDIRLLNYHEASDRGAFVLAMPSADQNAGIAEKIRISSTGDSIQIMGKGGPATGFTSNVQQTDVYIKTKTDMTGVMHGEGGECAGLIRFEDKGGNNSRYHGIDLRNKNNGDLRILNHDVGASDRCEFVIGMNTSHGGIETFRINQHGYHTRPKQPAFVAKGSGSYWTMGNLDDIPFTTEEEDTCGCYNTTNSRFTAPIAGWYHFWCNLFLYGTQPTGENRIAFKKNGGGLHNMQSIRSANHLDTWNLSVVTKLSANDYITVGSWQNISGTQIYRGHCAWGGYMVG